MTVTGPPRIERDLVAEHTARPKTQRTGKAAYVFLFCVVLPLALIMWARRLDMFLAIDGVHWPVTGIGVVAVGVALMLSATLSFWVHGGGLPASPFPPERLVTRGLYRLFADPIYIGAVLLSLGVSLFTASGAGLFIVTPTLAAMATAWVMGFERSRTRARFGSLPVPLVRLPADSDAPPTSWQRLSVYLLVLLPWFVLFMGVELLGTPSDAIYIAPAESIPVLPWTELVYFATYPFVASVPLIARRSRTLREFAEAGLFATALVIPFYLLVPIAYEARPVVGDGILQDMMRWERSGDGPITALPAFHVVWAFLAARVWSNTWPRFRALVYFTATLIALSCITTGMHAVHDVLAALALLPVINHRRFIWGRSLSVVERIANSWREWRVGPVRIINHGFYAGVGAAVGVAAASVLAGETLFWWLIGVTFAAIIGACLWAQFVEGSPSLLRPYGYFGSIAGVIIALVVAAAYGVNVWLLVTAFALGSTITYAFGRLRCLVQGCCHGRETSRNAGICYVHPRSRVVRLSELGGKPLYATPFYSLTAMLVVGMAMLRLWIFGAPLSFVLGTYFLLVGLARFVEEDYRGEPQTAVFGGLRLYQWLAIGMIIAGGCITAVQAPASPPISSISLWQFPALVLLAVIVTVFYGVDFPSSNRRFSRLT